MTDYAHITFESINDFTMELTLHRPDAANALNQKMAEEITAACDSMGKDHPKTRVLIITGSGRTSFCAGADLKERAGMDKTAWQAQHKAFEAALASISKLDIPVIALVNGAAYGGGLELALACDFIYASEDASFALPEASLGIMPGLGGTQRLRRAVGERRAKEMLFTGQPCTAQLAAEWGLINKVVGGDVSYAEIAGVADAIVHNAPLSVKAIKQAVQEGRNQPLGEALKIEQKYYDTLIGTQDRVEGIDAFNAKRKPVFQGS